MLAGPLRMLDPDEAVTGLMAARIGRGSDTYTYFAGQRYMGAAEQYLQAPFAAIWPGNGFALRLPQVALAAWAVWLVYSIGRRMFGDRRALVAAWLFAAGPAFNLVYGVKSRGAYGAAEVVGLLGLLVALAHRDGHREVRTGAAFGLCAGLAAWLSALAAVLLLPALLWVVGGRWQRRRRAALAAGAGFVVGASPMLVDWVRRGVSTGLGSPPSSTPWERLRGLFDPVLPEYLGLSWRAGEPILPRLLGVAAGLGLAALWAVTAVRRHRALRALVTPRAAGRRRRDLLLLAVPIAGALYVGSSYTWYTAEPRYLFLLYPVLALGVAGLVPATGRRGSVAAGLVVVLTGALAAGTLATKAGADYRADLARAAAFLDAAGQRDVFTDYQLGYPLSYYQGARLRAVPYGDNATRFPDLYRAVATAPHPAYAVLDIDARGLARVLSAHGVGFRLDRFGRIWTFTDLAPVRTPRELGLTRRRGPLPVDRAAGVGP